MSLIEGHFIVEGDVQGVCYRISCRQKARELGLNGWVRNRPDGSVEVVAEGEEHDVLALLAWCRSGPPASDVTGVQTIWNKRASRKFLSFEVK